MEERILFFSAIKWNDSRFDELVREGQNVLTHKEENDLCNVIHLPDNFSNINTEVRLDDGMKHLKINARSDWELHQLILNYSTKLFDNSTNKGKNRIFNDHTNNIDDKHE